MASRVNTAMDPQPGRPPSTTVPANRPRPVDPLRPDEGPTCQIVFWRGYRKARFYACVFDEADEPFAFAESPAFKAPRTPLPDATEQAVAAHDALTESLSQEGWDLVAKGPGWYDATFRRSPH